MNLDDPIAPTKLEFESTVFAMSKRGHRLREIAIELKRPLEEVQKAYKVEEGRQKRKHRTPPTRAAISSRIMDMADVLEDRIKEGVSADDLSKCIRTHLLCVDQVARLHGLYAPVKTEAEISGQVTLVNRQEQALYINDAEYRRKAAELEQHAINSITHETHDARRVRPFGEAREVSLSAPCRPDESELHEAGGAGDDESGDLRSASSRED